MTRQWDEKFEGTGYEETWSYGETVGAGNTLDEDADPSDVGSPAGWDSQCLKAINADSNQCQVAHAPGDHTWAYYRMEFVLTTWEVIVDEIKIANLADDGQSEIVVVVLAETDGEGEKIIRFKIDHDGGGLSIFASDPISFNTLYRVEWKFDISGNAWEWRINDVTQDSGSLTSTHATLLGEFALGFIDSGIRTATIYLDNYAIDDADWLGSDAPAGSNLEQIERHYPRGVMRGVMRGVT